MDFAKILDLINKAETVAAALIAAGQNAAPAWAAIKNLFQAKETITQADMDAADVTLDTLLEQFNEPLPPA